ncbi:MAG: methylenetetrahydrofolate reductase C-terminal domain-containing protein [Candidatus Ratteibacteria bacterium]
MLITHLKPENELVPILSRKPLVVCCFGCAELFFPEEEILSFLSRYPDSYSGLIRCDYLCNREFCKEYLSQERIHTPSTVLIFSCGVGIQSAAEHLESIPVFAGCDTLMVNGFQGISITENQCHQCGECRLNETGGICPITACAKGLLNGPCGGAKNGKCEVDPAMECGWEKIWCRWKEQGKINLSPTSIAIRDYEKLSTGRTGSFSSRQINAVPKD